MSNLIKVMSETINTQKRWLTPSDLEAKYDFSKSWQSKARMATSDSNLSFLKMGNFIRYDRYEIDEWIEKHKVR
ncbi:hypothetical protein ACKGJI_08865 [Sulfurospirillum sp. 1307]